MKAAPKKLIRIAVVENDPLRFVGFRALFEGDSGFALQSHTPASIFKARGYDVILIGGRTGSTMYQIMAGLKGLNPSVRMIATGSSQGDEMALRALCAGAKGFIDESASAEEFKEAIRVVNSGSVWASRPLLSKFIERVTNTPRNLRREEPLVFTDRER